ncbi:MAG: hypothetical protein RR444_03955 [Oscillospiraceae bacterium]
MTGLDIGSFMDKIYYGDEIEFRYNNTTYFVQGSCNDNQYFLTVDYWNAEDGSEPQHDYLLTLECDTPEEKLKKFEDANIFNDKNIYEIAPCVDVVFG